MHEQVLRKLFSRSGFSKDRNFLRLLIVKLINPRNRPGFQISSRTGKIWVTIFERRRLLVVIPIKFRKDDNGLAIMIFSSKSLGNIHHDKWNNL